MQSIIISLLFLFLYSLIINLTINIIIIVHLLRYLLGAVDNMSHAQVEHVLKLKRGVFDPELDVKDRKASVGYFCG